MSEEDIAGLTEVKMKRLRNLRMFKGKSDEDIYEFYRNRKPKPAPAEIPAETKKPLTEEQQYEKSFKEKLKALQQEFGVDMNSSNDAELLRSLVRHLIQQENVNIQIQNLQRMPEIDTRTLKNLGDFQRTLSTSIIDIQEKLNITRKLRKEKQIDDVQVFITDLKKRAKDFFEGKTVKVMCDRDGIELARYWLNFPDTTEAVHFEIKCWKCGEAVIFTR